MSMPRTFVLLCFFAIVFSGDAAAAAYELPEFREAPAFRNGRGCAPNATIHIAMTLDATYLRGSLAGALGAAPRLVPGVRGLPLRRGGGVPAPPGRAPRRRGLGVPISSSVRRALDQPLNYARIYLADLLPRAVRRVIYLDSDLVVVDDVARLWSIDLGGRVLGAPEYCHANLSAYFTAAFWSHPSYPAVFAARSRRPCYFNTGVMVIDLDRWRAGACTRRLEGWMEVQKREARIYELGSLPPFLLVFAGRCGGGAQVEPARPGRGQPGGPLPGPASGPRQPAALEREGQALAPPRRRPPLPARRPLVPLRPPPPPHRRDHHPLADD
uniref:Hexosyltransferase n=1 Tax=Ananas comosus var. bracteatus TaxID=296719 RepID=A0A6V7QMJ3_ANACO|nr:unnamed protein product [Ananas comosus var. bracteatus]